MPARTIFSDVTASDGSLQLLALFEALSECADPKQVLTTAAAWFDRIFGEYAVFAVLRSDPAGEHWRLLPLCNPAGPVPGTVAAEELPPNMDMDTLLQEKGKNVTRLLREQTPQLSTFLRDSEDAFTAHHGNTEGASPLLTEARAVLAPLEIQTILASSSRRPGGGYGLVMLGYKQAFLSQDLLKLFARAVKVTTRLSFYPDYVALVARMEESSQSLRRNIVHDLKTPVAAMKGCADTLLTPGLGDNPEVRQELLLSISEYGERLLEDLGDILNPLGAEWAPKLEEFDLSLLLQRVAMAERHTARAAAHTILICGAQEPLQITADRRKVRRLLENLLGNAVKYSPGAGKTVRVTLTSDAHRVHVSFIDEGIGMTPEQLARVQAGAGRAVEPGLGIEGTGFGLDSCRRVLEAHGGTLEMASALHRGTHVRITLPRSPFP